MHNITKEALSVTRADCHEISAFAGIIETLKPKRPAAMSGGGVSPVLPGRGKQRPYSDKPKGIAWRGHLGQMLVGTDSPAEPLIAFSEASVSALTCRRSAVKIR